MSVDIEKVAKLTGFVDRLIQLKNIEYGVLLHFYCILHFGGFSDASGMGSRYRWF